MTRARLISVVLIAAGAFGCSFRGLPLANDGDGGVLFQDAPLADAYIPDAGPCINSGKTCAGPILRTCQMEGQFPPDEEVCGLGCLSESGPPRCGRLRPSGGVLTLADLDANMQLMDRKGTSNNGVINTDDGSISGVRAAGPGVVDGIDFQVRPLGNGRSVGVFRVRKLNLEGSWSVRGTNALAIAAFTDIGIKGRLDVRGECNGTGAGPGGFPGGAVSTAAADSGGGAAGVQSGQGPGSSSSGGGGGAHGDNGGEGGRQDGGRPAGGVKFGDDTITSLVGGGGGGGGAGGVGGGGGGAVQLAANGTITVEYGNTGNLYNGINAGGCGGTGGTGNGGGGGGAGGTILIEAKTFVLDYALIAVNGGGGGGGNSTDSGDSGEWGNNTANGGTPAAGGGPGGRGGAAGNRPGARGGDAKEGGGGGGGVGRIRINTLDAQGIQLKNIVIISPSFGEGNTTSTKGAANVQ